MRLAILSDLHFGDEHSVLTVKIEGSEDQYELGPGFSKFEAALAGEKVDFLVLMGDLFDFAMAGYDGAYRAAKPFFEALNRLTDKIIYIPGNHDFEFWNVLEYEVNIINRLKNNKAPRDFKWSVPCVIDDRKASLEEKIDLIGVMRNVNGTYGGTYLDSLGKDLTFYVAFPNLYLIDEQGDTILVTHGQYMEHYWAVFGEFVSATIDGLPVPDRNHLDIKDMVALNFPTNQLASSGVGLSGPFQKVAAEVQGEIYKEGHSKALDHYIGNMADYFKAKSRGSGFWGRIKGWMTGKVINFLKNLVLKKVATIKAAQFNKDFLADKGVRDRFRRYYRSSMQELQSIEEHAQIKHPKSVIFGHTHIPIPWSDNSYQLDKIIDGAPEEKVSLHNCGGWIKGQDNQFVGASIFIYESGKPMRSVDITTLS